MLAPTTRPNPKRETLNQTERQTTQLRVKTPTGTLQPWAGSYWKERGRRPLFQKGGAPADYETKAQLRHNKPNSKTKHPTCESRPQQAPFNPGPILIKKKGAEGPFLKVGGACADYETTPQPRDAKPNSKTKHPTTSQDPNRNISTQGPFLLRKKGAEGPFLKKAVFAPTTTRNPNHKTSNPTARQTPNLQVKAPTGTPQPRAASY